jgi:hypothetical protein
MALQPVEPGPPRCRRCHVNEAVGPCAHCRDLVCADCAELVTGLAKPHALCRACAAAGVGRGLGRAALRIVLPILFGLGVIVALLLLLGN